MWDKGIRNNSVRDQSIITAEKEYLGKERKKKEKPVYISSFLRVRVDTSWVA
jgi:hypothetical protein